MFGTKIPIYWEDMPTAEEIEFSRLRRAVFQGALSLCTVRARTSPYEIVEKRTYYTKIFQIGRCCPLSLCSVSRQDMPSDEEIEFTRVRRAVTLEKAKILEIEDRIARCAPAGIWP